MVIGIGPLLVADNYAYYVTGNNTPESNYYYRDGSYCSLEMRAWRVAYV